jgi:hypothetical protein
MKGITLLFIAAAFVWTSNMAGCSDDNGNGQDTQTDRTDVPDVTADDATTPDPVEDPTPDTVEDLTPDTAPDTVEDVTDGGEIVMPTDACTNTEDRAIIEGGEVDVQGEATTCGIRCLTDSDPVGCSAPCVSEATGLSLECSTCYAFMISCTMEHCLSDCMADPGGETCVTCLEDAGCIGTFDECTGL